MSQCRCCGGRMDEIPDAALYCARCSCHHAYVARPGLDAERPPLADAAASALASSPDPFKDRLASCVHLGSYLGAEKLIIIGQSSPRQPVFGCAVYGTCLPRGRGRHRDCETCGDYQSSGAIIV
jgi:hypothetical protein